MTKSQTRPKLLDLFCGAGGAGMGYYQAGFDVVGVDLNPQPDYPFKFYQYDAIDYVLSFGRRFDAIHASPPCQGYSGLNAYNHKTYPELIGPVREALIVTNRPYVIENVEDAASELREPAMLCGPMFGLPMYRHRLFETSFGLAPPNHHPHRVLCSRNGYLPTPERPFMSIHGGKHSKAWQRAASSAMGMPWVRLPERGGNRELAIREICEAIPPAYTHFIGQQLMASLGVAVP